MLVSCSGHVINSKSSLNETNRHLQSCPCKVANGMSPYSFKWHHWKDWCWSWNSNTLATWCEELTYWKRPWCWEKLRAGGEGDDRGWDGWMASRTWWMWVWVNSGSWWWVGRPGMLRSMGSQRVGHDWATELNWLYDCSVLYFVKCQFKQTTPTEN